MSTLRWYLNPPTIHASIHQLLALLGAVEEGAGDAAELEDAAVAYADRSRSDMAFLAFPPSMIAVAAVLCALRARRADPARTEAFLAAVKAADLPYASAPRAAERIRACGVLLLGLDEDVVALDDEDLEVEAYADQTHPLLDSDSEEDLEENHAPSPPDLKGPGRIRDERSGAAGAN